MPLIFPQPNVFGGVGIPCINWSHPLSYKLAFCSVTQPGYVFDLITGRKATIATGVQPSVSLYGLPYKAGSTDATKADFGTWQPLTGGDTTIIAIANPAASGVVNPFLFNQRHGSTDYTQITLLADVNYQSVANSGYFALYVQNTVGLQCGANATSGVDGNFHVFGGKFLFGGNASVWLDGKNVTASAPNSVAGTLVTGSQAVVVGGVGAQAADDGAANCSIPLVLAWNRALSDAEMIYIGKNPYCFLIYPYPRSQVISTGTGPTLNIAMISLMNSASWRKYEMIGY
jgi:hypothetical protein